MTENSAWRCRQFQKDLNIGNAAVSVTADENRPLWIDGKTVDEVAYCEHMTAEQEIRCINNRLYTIDGLLEDFDLQKRIAEDLKPYVRSGLYKKVDRILQTLKILCISKPVRPSADRIHFSNGTYLLGKGFTQEKEWTMNRLPVRYPEDAAPPVHWLKFLSELLYEEDIVTLQEYLGYMMVPTNKGQSMFLIIGSGGEGKSCIGVAMQHLFGKNINMGDLTKLETDRFSLANQEGKLGFIDDDMSMEALPSASTLKAIVTCDGCMDLERKNQQSYQGLIYVRILGFSNGSLKSLHDKTNGFYRRQIIVHTKDKAHDRVDDPYLADKLTAESEAIARWCVDGLIRLVKNDFRFTISERSGKLKSELMETDNNIQAFLSSTGYIAFEAGARETTSTLYAVYRKWCCDNAEKPMASSSFSKYLHQNQSRLGIESNKNVPLKGTRYARGFNGIKAVTDGFFCLPDEGMTPFG